MKNDEAVKRYKRLKAELEVLYQDAVKNHNCEETPEWAAKNAEVYEAAKKLPWYRR